MSKAEEYEILTTVYDPMEAELIKGLLESHGIEVVASPIGFGQITGINDTAGPKIPIYVKTADLPDAMEIINSKAEEPSDEEIDREHERIMTEKKNRTSLKNIWLLAAVVFFFLANYSAQQEGGGHPYTIIFSLLSFALFILHMLAPDTTASGGRPSKR